MKVAADPEQVDGTILDGRDYSSGQLPQENIRIIKEADATLRLNLGTQLDALYDRPHKEITGYRPKCVSVLSCVPLWQWAFLLFELYGRGTRGRPECVSGMAGQALRHNG